MRVKEIERTANVAWSPAAQYPIYMVAGTAAQQLDATFSTSAALEVYSLSLTDPTLNMPLVATVPSDCRFHKLVWGSHGMSGGPNSSGFIVGGTDNGGVYCYSASKMIQGDKDCLQFKQDKHTGAVKALDFNPFQTNLLATGASDSEIHIWDLNKPDSPMTPGAKSQPPEEVACVSWNRQVQHILASTFTARCVVWDLRKNEPIIKISESMSRMKSKSVAWHPDVATQLCLASEDDHTPVIQLWDLRYATSPLKVLENHKRGVLDIAWCTQDSDLLLSCGKDNRILCWNPNSNKQDGEVVYELPTSTQWSFDVQWCPRNPGIISSSSFDGHVTMYSLMGGGHPVKPSNKVADSFSTNDPFSQSGASHTLQQTDDNVMPLQKPPKWLRKPCGASFAFGGKLVSFEGTKSQPSAQQQSVTPREVYVSQVVTETDLITSSTQLEQALMNGQYVEFCAMKAANSKEPMQESIWNFLRVNFEKEPREHYIQLLGYDKTDLAKKVAEYASGDNAEISQGVDASELAQKMSLLDTDDVQNRISGSGQASPNVGSKTPISRDEFNSSGSSAFDDIAAQFRKLSISAVVPFSGDDIFEDVSEFESEALSKGPGSRDELSAFDDIAAVQKMNARPQSPLTIPTNGDSDGLLSQALLMGNFEAAVEICLSEDKMAEAILLAIAGGPDLLSRTQKTYFKKNKSSLGRLISSVVTHNWSHIVETCNLDNWKEALALILTYSSSEEFVSLCDTLACRLESEQGGDLSMYASLCYICSGNVDKLVENWHRNTQAGNTPLGLQDLVEKVMILRKAVTLSRGQEVEVTTGLLADKLNNYASLLAAQGSMETAMRYLGNSTEVNLSILKDRLFNAIGQTGYGNQAPAFPFSKVNVMPEGTRPAQTATAQRTTSVTGPTHTPKTYQTQANSDFGTSTTGSTSYMNPNQYSSNTQYNTMNGLSSPSSLPGQSQGYGGGQGQFYNPNAMASVGTAPVSHAGSGASAASKGPLSYKYPSYPQPNTGYGMGSYSQPNYPQGSYNNPSYSQPNYYGDSGANPAGSQMTPSQTSNIYNPTNTMTGGSQHAGASSTLPPQHSFMDHKPSAAWNDPPLVKDRKPKTETPSQAPLTSPLYGTTPQTGGQNIPSDQGPPGAPMNYSNLYNPQEHQREVQAPPSNVPAPEPVKPVAKQPIPSEHQVLQDIFSLLVNNCTSVASNAPMKRKLEDVNKKLEILYDRLRQEALSQNVLLGLHQIVQAIQQSDYNTGLHVYTQMVSQGNFSEISSFMPGLKMLLQSAMQMHVYVQGQ